MRDNEGKLVDCSHERGSSSVASFSSEKMEGTTKAGEDTSYEGMLLFLVDVFRVNSFR